MPEASDGIFCGGAAVRANSEKIVQIRQHRIKSSTYTKAKQGISDCFFYSGLNLNQYSVASPCRTICTVCGFVALS
ncbi:TPA: hypothetical protein ACJJKZ_002020 [Neisseria meningitidis]